MNKLKVSVLGTGNGGQALSAYLAMKGVEVNLFEHPSFKKNIEEISKMLNDFFCNTLYPLKNLLEICFSNPNTIVHCPTMILNSGRIESTNGDFMFY